MHVCVRSCSSTLFPHYSFFVSVIINFLTYNKNSINDSSTFVISDSFSSLSLVNSSLIFKSSLTLVIINEVIRNWKYQILYLKEPPKESRIRVVVYHSSYV